MAHLGIERRSSRRDVPSPRTSPDGERSPMTTDATAGKSRRLEVRSIDYVPTAERHGQVRHLFPVWFQGNANLATLTVGMIGGSVGLNFAWSATAIIVGCLVGTLFMAFHSAQGPKLGLPQMIQSRPQFGYYGSLLPVIIAVLLFIGFNIVNTEVGGQAVQAIINSNFVIGALILVAIAVGLTIIGYDLIHKALRWATYVFIVVYGYFTIAAIGHVHLAHAQTTFGSGSFNATSFLLQVGAAASFQLTWAPYVSEYSRYLPVGTKTSATFWYTYLGSLAGGVWMMVLGAFLAGGNPSLSFTTVPLISWAANGINSHLATPLLILSIPGLVAVTAMNMYSGGLSTLAVTDVFKPTQPTVTSRVWSIGFITVAATVLTFALPGHFITDFTNFLYLVLYFMIPWTAVNLIDFFFVRHEKYALLEIYKKDGIYGAWGWRGITAYVVGFVAMIPFMSNVFYTGPVAHALNGADITPVIGFPVAAIVYYVLCRNLDLSEEQRLAEEQLAELEKDQFAA
jgi:nucleobase:cation symporter-1, NCS1 family